MNIFEERKHLKKLIAEKVPLDPRLYDHWLKQGCADCFTFAVNLPDASIDIISPLLIGDIFDRFIKKTGIKVGYILTREAGKNGLDDPTKSHYHLWCHSSYPIRLDNFIRDYFKPLIEKVGFPAWRCTSKLNGRKKYSACKASKVRNHKTHEWDDWAYSFGYINKEAKVKTNTLSFQNKDFFHVIDVLFEDKSVLKDVFSSRILLMDKVIKASIAYYLSFGNNKHEPGRRITEGRTETFLDMNYGEHACYAESALAALKDGYYFMLFKSSVRVKGDRLNDRNLIYIYQLFSDPLPERLQRVLDYNEQQSSRVKKRRKFS